MTQIPKREKIYLFKDQATELHTLRSAYPSSLLPWHQQMGGDEITGCYHEGLGEYSILTKLLPFPTNWISCLKLSAWRTPLSILKEKRGNTFRLCKSLFNFNILQKKVKNGVPSRHFAGLPPNEKTSKDASPSDYTKANRVIFQRRKTKNNRLKSVRPHPEQALGACRGAKWTGNKQPCNYLDPGKSKPGEVHGATNSHSVLMTDTLKDKGNI